MANAQVYSIWLQPTGEVRAELAGIISRLSREYATPSFEPHVTLIGDLVGQEKELLNRTEQLARRLRPFIVQLGDIGYLDEFYRCLYIRVQEREPVIKANAESRQVFLRESDAAYMPHLSLVYANMPPAVKEEIIAQIGKTFRQSFPVDRLYLVSTQGETKEWYHLGEFAL